MARARIEGVVLEDLCYQAQQAVEKALKAVILTHAPTCPRVHDLDLLLERLADFGIEVPEGVDEASTLTRYAVETRYPGLSEEVTTPEYEDALAKAETVLAWVRSLL